MAHIHNADAPELHIIADQLRRAADQGMAAHPADLYRVVGDEAMAALDKLQGRLALADAAVAHEQHTLAVDLHQHAVHRHARGQVFLQGMDQIRLKFRGILIRDENTAVILPCHLDTFGEGGYAVADHEGRNIVLHEALEGAAAFLGREAVKIGALDPADDLDAAGVEVIVKAGELQSRAVHIRGGHQGVLIIGGQMQRRDAAVPLDDLLQFDRILAAHTRSRLPFLSI